MGGTRHRITGAEAERRGGQGTEMKGAKRGGRHLSKVGRTLKRPLLWPYISIKESLQFTSLGSRIAVWSRKKCFKGSVCAWELRIIHDTRTRFPFEIRDMVALLANVGPNADAWHGCEHSIESYRG